MIRINLLPVKERIRTAAGIRQLAVIAGILVIAVVALASMNIAYERKNDELRESISKTEAEIKRLEELIGAVNQLEADRDKLLKQLEVIHKLEKGKTGPVKMLDAIATTIPKRVWLTSLEESDQNLSLEGFGIENSDVSDFMRALQKEAIFSNVRLHFTEQTSDREFGQPVVRFSLTMKVDYNS